MAHGVRKSLVAVVGAVLLTGCYEHYTAEAAPSPIVYESGGAYGFLFGAVAPSVDNLVKRCPFGSYSELRRMTGAQVLGAIVTYGLWTPMTARVVCARDPNYYAKFGWDSLTTILVKSRRVVIGMTPDMVIESIGRPASINRTTTVNGFTEQWVYSSSLYVYFDAGKVSAIQDTR